MNYYEEAEKILRNIPKLETALSNLKRRERMLIERQGPSDVDGVDTSKGYTTGVAVNNTLNTLCELQEVIRERRYTEEDLALIKTVISQLASEEQKIIDLWYCKELPRDVVCHELHMSPPTLYDKRNKAVQQFAILYFGAKAI